MPVTSKEIARIAGVSRGTVDRVLNQRSGVKEETRRRVSSIAEELGYVPNRAGKALSSSRRPLEIGLVLNCEENHFYDEIFHGIESCKAAYADFSINLHYCRLKGYEAESQLSAIDLLCGEGIGALIITPVSNARVASRIDALVKSGIPVATLNLDIENTRRLLHVGCNYYASGQTAGGMLGLLCGGNGSVGIVSGSFSALGHNQRVSGFLSVMSDLPLLSHVQTIENNDDDTCSYRLVKEMLTSHPEITALYFAAAGLEGGVRAVTELRADNMPLILACDDAPATKELLLDGRIQATICQEPFRQGYEVVRLVLEHLITGQPPEHTLLYMNNEIKIKQNI